MTFPIGWAGIPMKPATPGEVLDFVTSRFGFDLTKQKIDSGLGVSEFLFKGK